MKSICAAVHHNGHVTTVHWDDDGRECAFVEVQELRHGDEILGWNGEPWTWGKVDYVETYLHPSYGLQGLSKRWVTHMQDGPSSSPLVNGESLRRIVPRGDDSEHPYTIETITEDA